MRLKTFCIASLLFLSSAGCAVKPPKGWMCILNAHGEKGAYNLCYNLETDFDAEGRVKAVAGQRVPVKSLDDLHAHVNMDVDSYSNLKAYFLKLKERFEQDKRSACLPGGS